MPLLVITPPKEDESPLGFYRRLASENQLDGWKELTRQARVARSRSGLLGQSAHVANELGLDPSWALTIQAQEDRVRKFERLHRGLHDAVCPQCLRDQPYLRLHWEHVYSTACGVHRTRLLDKCDSCGLVLDAKRPEIEYCGCGRDLRAQSAPPATPSEIWLSALLAGASQIRAKVGPKIVEVDEHQLVRLIRLLCHFYDPHAGAPPRNASPPRSIDEAVHFLIPLRLLLEDWPFKYQTHIAERFLAADPSATTPNSALGHWYKQLKQICVDGPLRPFLDIVAEAAPRNCVGLTGLDAAGTSTRSYNRLVPVKVATKRLGLGRDSLYAAIELGHIKGHVRKFGQRRIAYQIEEQEIERIEVLRKSWIDIQTACKTLDVPESVFSSLILSGAIERDVRWNEDILKAGPISLTSVTTLIANAHQSWDAKSTSTELIKMRQLTSRRVGDKLALSKLFQAIVSGELRSVGGIPKEGIGELTYPMNEIRKYFGTPLLEAGMTIQQLSDMTGWKYESISEWINTGLLMAESIQLRGQPCRVVMPTQLVQFGRQFIPVADLAHSIGITSSALVKRLKDVMLVGGKRLPNGVQRGALVRICDLARLALTR